MKLFDDFKQLIAQIKTIAALTKKLQSQQQILSKQLIDTKTVLDDVQIDIEKMNFKNKPHLDRIQKTMDHLNTELSKFKA
ncbi:hypothetical protein LEGA110927_01155 [Leuconostoc gasicomitatum]|uniref:hypothetical protein n=1 Tax=Leuconostoc gasicomitatum TaxID=115778 RepID=UPI000BD48E61|nr:hypothetical protein [Leuconostoc gasicomitatum]MBR2276517.1 hypothetical protein [Leuconostoc sp.]MBZ5944671.1 hypothetical protein [Leuconostoc gasicomitatum]MBZ5945396.1 hypothetical protein [Leuconostoc gasicomitatum]MBZ5949437.1 hypothetical protein [Leuconostoc gasicomitatum]MBZ5958775.1 hypothetical protein [Leuconostoc gasicomitatum]